MEIKNISSYNKKWIVYEHISPSNKVYIGITCNKDVNKRWRYGYGYKNCKVFQRAIDKYGWNNFKHNIIASNLGERTAKNMEKDLIAFNKAKGTSYNITDGGEGYLGGTHIPSEETRKLWSEQRRGRRLSKEWKEKISKSLKNKEFSIEHQRRAGLALKQKKAIIVNQYNLDGEYITTYESIKDAARSIGNVKADSDIIRNCKGKTKYSHGYIWRYKDN